MNRPHEVSPPLPDQVANVRSGTLTRLRLATPREHESALIAPPWADLSDLVHTNAKMLTDSDVDLNGVSLRTLRQQVRKAVIAEAAAYTGTLTGEDVVPPDSATLIVTGHQPELFHAGVWAKNFSAGSLARSAQATALNLIIDNDTVASTRIKIPVGSHDSPTIEWLPFDEPRPQQPWEEATILQPALFRSFADRVSTRIQECWGFEPLVASSWPAAIDQMKHSPRLCDCLAAARVAAERSHGLRNLEVPMSLVCSTSGFDYFLAFLLSRLRKFHAAYNSAIREYRRAYRMRSTTHPVPELDAEGEWLEIPFWIWRAGDHKRLRPFARQIGPRIELRAGGEVLAVLPVAEDADLSGAVDALSEVRSRGLRVRTRALTTTLFARLFLADLFIHGIGGAKYDAMTDRICEDFLGMCPPQFATVSATVFLPLGEPYPIPVNEVHRREQRIRDLRYNPDRYISNPSPLAQALVRDKAGILTRLASRRPSKNEHRRLATINTELYRQTEPLIAGLKGDLERIRKQMQANLVLEDREFSWCVQPADAVISFFQRQFPQ